MYSRMDLFRLGFKKSQIESAAAKGLLDHVFRIRPGGQRIYSASNIIELAEELGVTLSSDCKEKLQSEISDGIPRM